ncbi:alpha-(1,3)-fucosyltransferase 9 [Elysia marginata]|uniref:Alpha-(1,3)-fucosyltransferase 9 n=1 Tax=Elysia marginata TaxID=1093978 RepID=A0AAV4G0Y9_9GAST|nr:alpha-(1,3)-fucosyltransferase 9 [Elysia marginata]
MPPFAGRKLRRVFKILAVLLLFLFAVLVTLVSFERQCPSEGCEEKSREFVHKFPERHIRPNSDTKRILRWTGFFEDTSWESTDDSYLSVCKERRCTLTNDRELLDQSDAVLFHVGALWNFWRGISLPSRRHPFQTWILHNVEPPPRVPLDLSKYAGIFNWTAFYRRCKLQLFNLIG